MSRRQTQRGSLRVKRSPTRAGLSGSMQKVEGGIGNLNSKMDIRAKNLKDEMTDAFCKEGLRRKKDSEALETRMETKKKRKKDSSGRTRIHEGRNNIRFGLGSGTHARPPPLGSRWKDTLGYQGKGG